MYCQVSARSDFLNFSLFPTFSHLFTFFGSFFLNISVDGAMIHEVTYGVG